MRPSTGLLGVDADEAETVWDDVVDWLVHPGLTVLLILLGAFFATRVVNLIARRQMRRVDARARAEEGAAMAGHQRALVGALRWAANFVVVFVAVIWVLLELNLPAAALLPLASAVGVGLGFGAQRIVGDVLAGIFILSERQFGVGDLVKIGPLMAVGWVEGHVEELTLRVTKVRTYDGDLVTIANGELRQTVNASRDWARVLVIVPLARDVDVEAVATRLDLVGQRFAADPAWSEVILEAPKVGGLEDLGADSIQMRVVGRSVPGQQWKAARELRRRIVLALREVDVEVRAAPAAHDDLAADTDD